MNTDDSLHTFDFGISGSPNGADDSSACRGCGQHVSAAFVRVMSDNNGDVHRCVHCATQTVGAKAAGGTHSVFGGVVVDFGSR
jgi:hypothetical protein